MTDTRQWRVAGLELSLALSLAGCAGDLPAATSPQPAPANYRQMAAAYFVATQPKQPIADAAITPIQPVVAPQPADWFACVKFASGDYYAVFYTGGAVVDARNALAIDRCSVAEGYAPFPPPAAPAKPAKSKKGAKG